MESISVGELKSRFSEVLERVKKGEEIIISYGKMRKKVAVLLPYDHYAPRQDRRIGLFKERGPCVIHEDIKLTEEEMLSS